ncbi:MAG TPA: hypothetical protein DD791_11410 [Syntrophomonas sp.]|nr:hypothetical protein [Syntrophomonas sp.]
MTYSQISTNIQNKKRPLFIQPFNLFFLYYDLHVMIYFEGHSEYESIEAMIVLNGEEPLIRGIITRHDQTQIDYINNKPLFDKMKNEVYLTREVYFTPMEFIYNCQHKEYYLEFKFSSIKGEAIDFIMYTVGKPSPRYGGLINPGGHSRHECLPVMWRDRSTLASPRSRIIIDGKAYSIPVKINVPPFFKGLKAYYSEGFSLGVLTTADVSAELITLEQFAGNGWSFKKGDCIIEYHINPQSDDFIIIENDSISKEIIKCQISDMKINIKEITMMDTRTQDKKISIKFAPALPDLMLMDDQEQFSSKFSISINDHRHLLDGVVTIIRRYPKIIINLIPKNPKWAARRVIKTEISHQGQICDLKSIMLNTSHTQL